MRLSVESLLASCLLATTIFLSQGCGSSRCNGGEGDDPAAGVPVVDKFFVLDQQIPGDPWTVLFGVDFSDSVGDLGTGRAEFFLNSGDTPPAVQELTEAFRQSGVDPAAASGSLWMALRFSDNITDGAEVRLGLQLVDDLEKRSNCYTLDLEFQVDAVATGDLLMQERALAARRVPCEGRS